jgi:hypothetical protein
MPFFFWRLFLKSSAMRSSALVCHAGRGGARIVGTVVIAAGIAVLATYGVFVNKVPLDFSSTLGLYVAFFAIVSCVIGGIRDREVKLTTIAGIVVILVGGLIINYGQKAAR